MALNQQEVEQLDVDASEFGRNAAGAVLTQIARYSPILKLINPHYYQTKDSSVQVPTESMDPSHCYFKQVGS